MKYLSALFLCHVRAAAATVAVALAVSGVAHASSFYTGQAARAEFGQVNFAAQGTVDTSFVNDTPTLDLGGVSGLAFANNSLFVVDNNRLGATPLDQRIVIFNNVSQRLPSPTQEITSDSGARCPICITINSNVPGDVVVGQPDFATLTSNLTQSGLRDPSAVATDGHILAIADTDNNRVLIWKSIPSTNGAPADIVLGQGGFTSISSPPVVSSTGMRGPQGVWIQGTRLFVADTLDNRILIWNSIPTQSNQAADLVLGQTGFGPVAQVPSILPPATASNMVEPTSVTSDGTHLFVSDLGQSRVMIWNSIPTQNNQPADVVVGQPDMISNAADNSGPNSSACAATGLDASGYPIYPAGCTTPSSSLCPSTGTDSSNNPVYPPGCAATLDFPRFALSDGTRLFIADTGNDRVMVYNTIPTTNGARADVILGQPDEFSDVVSDDTTNANALQLRSSADTVRSPLSLAFDGTNLYVSDPFDRRVLVFTPADINLPPGNMLNAASLETFAVGGVLLGGTITAGEVADITIGGTTYSYTVQKNDTFDIIITSLANEINGLNANGTKKTTPTPDPNAHATAQLGQQGILLTALKAGASGDQIAYSAAVVGVNGATATLTATAAGAAFAGGTSASEVAPGTLITIFAANCNPGANPPVTSGCFTDQSPASGHASGSQPLPRELAGVEYYVDGMRAPLLYVSPTQINAQVSFVVADTNASTGWVRAVLKNNSVRISSAINVPVVGINPGIFAGGGSDPRPALAIHASSYATAVVDPEGTPNPNDTATITIAGKAYTYTVQSTDVGKDCSGNTVYAGITCDTTANTLTGPAVDALASVQNGLIKAINADSSSPVTAMAGSVFHLVLLYAKTAGSAGNGITVASTSSSSSDIPITVLGNGSSTCCASAGGTSITASSPAVPGEFITIYTTGLGAPTNAIASDGTIPLVTNPPTVFQPQPTDGYAYPGPANNIIQTTLTVSVGNSAGVVVLASMVPGSVGVYRITVQIPSSLPANPQTLVTIFGGVYGTNTVTIPVN